MAERDRGRDYVPCRMLHPKPHSHCSIYLGKKQYILMTKIRAAQTVGQYHPYRLRLRRKESCWTRFCVFCAQAHAKHTKTCPTICGRLRRPACTYPPERSLSSVIGRSRTRVPIA